MMFATPSSVSPSPLNNTRVYRKHSASPFKTARFSPYKLPRKSSSILHLVDNSHAHPNPPPPAYTLPVVSDIPLFKHEGNEFIHTRHIKLDFELYRDGMQCTPSAEQIAAIINLFPTCLKLSFAPPFLIIVCTKLPVKPWPITVAGMPLYLTIDCDASPMNFGISPRGPKQVIAATLTRWKTPNLDTFKALFDLFDNLNANIHRLQWIGWCLLAVGTKEPDGDWRARLPWIVNRIRVGYIYKEDTMAEKTLRRKLPEGKIHDNEGYTSLRPGVMIASKSPSPKGETDMMTTSGICVQSPQGKKYITVAKHGFPGGVGDHVFHPNRDGRIIGEISKIFGETDIALAELYNVGYSRETFSAPDAAVSPFGSFLNTDQLMTGDFVYMDTPFNGRMEGIVMKIDVLRLPSDEPADNDKYIIGTFSYFGNGADTPFEGCCGGVVWNDNHDILGQFRFQGLDHLCYCPTFDILKRLGYSVAES